MTKLKRLTKQMFSEYYRGNNTFNVTAFIQRNWNNYKEWSKELEWIKSVLFNNEVASDEELIAYFMENGVTGKEAYHYVWQRGACLRDFHYELIPF